MTNIVKFTISEISIDGVLEIETRDCRMEGADNSTELWQFPIETIFWLTN